MKWDLQTSILSHRATIAARVLHWSIQLRAWGQARSITHARRQDSCKRKKRQSVTSTARKPHNLLISDWPPAHQRSATLTAKTCFAVKVTYPAPDLQIPKKPHDSKMLETETRAFGLTNREATTAGWLATTVTGLCSAAMQVVVTRSVEASRAPVG